MESWIPVMKHRLLDVDNRHELASNLASASSGASSELFTLHSRALGGKTYELWPNIHLRPGRRYLLEFKFTDQKLPG